MSSIIRPAAVAGQFYPGSPEELQQTVAKLLPPVADRRASGIMVPHAGLVYSGETAGTVFAHVAVPDVVIILCPNHTGRGDRIAVSTATAFRIPGGDVTVDRALADTIIREVPGATADDEAHRFEHAIEVELPFLLARNPEVRIVPIVLAGLSLDEAVALGVELHRIAETRAEDVLVVASSDMSHYLPDATCRKVDEVALAPLLDADPEALYRTVRENDITMCGYIPATAMLSYAREAGAGAPELLKYATSGDAFGDRSRVVGYAGVVTPA